ncbi:ABC transporter substrate-binding protein [Leisingera sp. M523]|uniref:ABC transporter substrate-binding protein n=1 Tax=Leisingera sp. M523 TaxID=2867013 RepID=UPI0021A82135|nr:ABC transporter substrate-binding protein [Leisingera sp. M523]UWQ28140.1 ABC transporter substrate-binding protein [Leisingera sp. M523]
MTVQASAMLLATALSAATDTFPVEIQHQSSLAAVPAKPERIVSVRFFGHNFLLALGQAPIALRKWHGNDRSGVWPWGHDALGDARPAVFQGEINFEKITALEPELIVGRWSGMTWRDDAFLSRIAPAIAPRAEFGSYGTPWQEVLHTLGAATGTSGRTKTAITRIESRVSAIREEHPERDGASAPLSWAGQTAAYTSRGIRSPLLEALGFQVPEAANGRVLLAERALAERGRYLGYSLWFACDKAESQHLRAALMAKQTNPKTSYIAAYWSQT